MPKAIKRVIRKKKQVKKSIHDKLKKRKAQTLNPARSIAPGIKDSLNPTLNPTLTNNNQTASNANNLRNQGLQSGILRNSLLARTMGINPIGFFPQQYGNINEQRVRELQQGNTLTQHKIENNNATISALSKEKKELKGKLKDSSNEVKSIKNELDRITEEFENAKDNENEKEKYQTKLEHLKDKLNEHILRYGETENDNELLKLKSDIETKTTELMEKQREHQRLESELNKNKAYQQLQQINDTLQDYVTKIASLNQTMASDEFQRSNEALIEKQKELEKQRYEYELKRKQMEQEKEIAELKLKHDARVDDKTYDELNNANVEAMKELNLEKLDIEFQIDEAQENVNAWNYSKQQLTKLKNETQNAKTNLHYWKGKKQHLDSVYGNGQIQKRVSAAAEELGKTEAQRDKAESAANDKKKAIETKKDEARIKSYNEEMNKDMDESEKKEVEEEGKEEAQVEIQKERSTSLKDKRAAIIKNAKAKSKNDFMNSKAAQSIQNDIIANETAAAQNQKAAEEREILNKTQEELEKMKIRNDIAENTSEASDVYQVQYTINNELKPKMDLIKQKDELYRVLMSEANQDQNAWLAFLDANDKVNALISNGNYRNQSVQYLNSIISQFRSFLKLYRKPEPTSALQPVIQQQPPPPQTINFDGVIDDGQFVEEEEENN